MYLVFDRCRELGIKCATRADRGKSVKKDKMYQLSNAMKQEDILKIPDNKKQLIALICDDLSSNVKFPETTKGG